MIQLPPELEQRLAKAAEAAGTTPDLLAQEYLSERLQDEPLPEDDDSLTLADLLGDTIGMLDSREFGSAGANLSQESETRFKEILFEKHRQGHL